MDWWTVMGVAVGVSMDALAVSVTNGCVIPGFRLVHGLRMAFLFGLFQGAMPALGWLAGISFCRCMQEVDHWIAFGLLLLVGAKMIYESRPGIDDEACGSNCLQWSVLLTLAVATSIDALAVGIGFAMLSTPIWGASVVIGCVTFVLCLAGAMLGSRLGVTFGKRLGMVGGVILILIGVRIVIEHTLKPI